MGIGISQWDCRGKRDNEERGALRRREGTCSMKNMVFVLVLVLGLIVRGRTRARKRTLGSMDWPEMSRPFWGKAADEDTCKVRNESLSQL